MGIENKILLAVSVVLLISICIGYFFVSDEVAIMTDENYRRVNDEMMLKWQVESRSIINRFNKHIEISRDISVREAAFFVNDDRVLEAYEIANKGDLSDANDINCKAARKKLKTAFDNNLSGIAEYSTLDNYKLHFHTKNSRSLARMWRKDWQVLENGAKVDITDDLSSFRHTINKVNTSGQNVSGIEVGRDGFYLRGVCPIKNKKKEILGSVEFLISLSEVISDMVFDENTNYAVYMPIEYLSIADSLRDSDMYPVLGTQFVRVSSTNGSLFDRLITLSVLDKIKDGLVNDVVSGHFLAGEPIIDFNGVNVGFFAIAINVQDDIKKKHYQYLEKILSDLSHLLQLYG